MSSSKKPTATPPDLAKALQDAYAEKYPHLADQESKLEQAQKERVGPEGQRPEFLTDTISAASSRPRPRTPIIQ